MPDPAHDDRRSCTHSALAERGAISLPVLAEHNPAGTIRKSKNAKRRAIILGTVQFLLLAHIVLWLLSKKYGWWGGQTITPIEPSESMEFVKSGVINAGLIFFAIALLSTLVLGRWFCGWGCHVVLLQDLCGWIMKKFGVRPKAFRSRLLIYVPLILAIYMFIMPAVHRWGLIPLDASMSQSLGEDHALVRSVRVASTAIGFPVPIPQMPEWSISTHLTTDDFWRTFARIGIAIPFLFVCGFAVVYFLGAKGFCTYGCPYGGFFTPLDRLAPARILVTDACEGCGHCTAVCTSNVRVHEEVREYGMVVNPGCMKCMDCVSVCPKEALYFGFAKPSILKGAPKHQTPKKIYDLTWPEELAFSAVFLLSFLAVRGVYGMVPMLMAVGIAGIVTFLSWKLWRMMRDANVNLYRYQLKSKGSLRRAGIVFGAIALLAIGMTAHSGMMRILYTRAASADDKVTIPWASVFGEQSQSMDEAMTQHADRALELYQQASSIKHGGYGLFDGWQSEIDVRRAWLLSAKQDYAAAEPLMRRVIERDGQNDSNTSGLMWILEKSGRRSDAITLGLDALRAWPNYPQTLQAFQQLAASNGDGQLIENTLHEIIKRHGVTDMVGRNLMFVLYLNGKPQEALEYADEVIPANPGFTHMLDFYRRISMDMENIDRAIAMCRRLLDQDPDHLHAMRLLSIMLLEQGEVAESVALTQRTLEIDSSNPSARFYLALGLSQLNRTDEAIAALQEGLALSPDSAQMHGLLSELLIMKGRNDEAEVHRARAQQIFEAQQSRAP